MNDINHGASSFLCGFAAYSDLFFCVKETAVDKDDGMVFQLLQMDEDDWTLFATFNWPHVAIASLKPNGGNRSVLSVGAKGDFYYEEFGTSTRRSGVIDENNTFLARNLSVIDKTIYVVGMGRKVARWEGTEKWTRLDVGAPLPEQHACGFNDLAGLSVNEMYAVGWRGEIWEMNGASWRQIDSPVSKHLRAACTLPDGMIIAVGYGGAMVKGRHDLWVPIESGRKEDLLDVCYHDGRVYVSTAFRILTLEDSGLVLADNFADKEDAPSTCGALYPAFDGSSVFSMGGKDLFRLNKNSWERVI